MKQLYPQLGYLAEISCAKEASPSCTDYMFYFLQSSNNREDNGGDFKEENGESKLRTLVIFFLVPQRVCDTGVRHIVESHLITGFQSAFHPECAFARKEMMGVCRGIESSVTQRFVPKELGE